MRKVSFYDTLYEQTLDWPRLHKPQRYLTRALCGTLGTIHILPPLPFSTVCTVVHRIAPLAALFSTHAPLIACCPPSSSDPKGAVWDRPLSESVATQSRFGGMLQRDHQFQLT